MPLFTKKTVEPVAEPPNGGGKEVLRRALHAANRAPAAIVSVAADIGVGSGVLDAFERGTGDLTGDQLGALAERFFSAAYDSGRDLLVSRSLPATPMGRGPDPWSGKGSLAERPPGVYPPPLYPRPDGAKDEPALLSRPGWA